LVTATLLIFTTETKTLFEKPTGKIYENALAVKKRIHSIRLSA